MNDPLDGWSISVDYDAGQPPYNVECTHRNGQTERFAITASPGCTGIAPKVLDFLAQDFLQGRLQALRPEYI